MPKLPEFITKKIGPLPVWSYVVIGGVLVFILRKRGGGSSSTANPAGTINIPTLTPGSGSSVGDSVGAGVGSPAQNWMGGSDTQPIGTSPSYIQATPGPGGANNPSAVPLIQPGTIMNQNSVSAGVMPKQTYAAPALVAPAGLKGYVPNLGWTSPPSPSGGTWVKNIDGSWMLTQIPRN